MDDAGKDPLALTDAQVKRYNDSYNTYLARLNNAWRPSGFSENPLGQPPQPPTTDADARAATNAAYQRYVDRISNAWRRG